jgi:hypothetical protein
MHPPRQAAGAASPAGLPDPQGDRVMIRAYASPPADIRPPPAENNRGETTPPRRRGWKYGPMNGPADAGTPPAPALRLAELLTVGDATDDSGRLLLEDSATKAARRRAMSQGILMRSATCHYRDTPSRMGGRMNVSAYEALRADAGEMLDGFAWLTEQILMHNPSTAGTVNLLYDVSYLGITVPLLLFHRAADPVPATESVPTVVASIFKASRGLFSVAVGLLNDNQVSDNQVSDNQVNDGSRAIEPEAVVEFADRHHHLARRDPPRVCAAPTRLIERTIEVILTGTGATPSASRLPAMVGFPLLWRFYRMQDDLSEALSTYSFVLGRLSQPGDTARPQELFRRNVPGTPGTFGQLTEAMLAHVNSAQEGLNRLLGRTGGAPPLGFRELLDLL